MSTGRVILPACAAWESENDDLSIFCPGEECVTAQTADNSMKHRYRGTPPYNVSRVQTQVVEPCSKDNSNPTELETPEGWFCNPWKWWRRDSQIAFCKCFKVGCHQYSAFPWQPFRCKISLWTAACKREYLTSVNRFGDIYFFPCAKRLIIHNNLITSGSFFL